MKLTSAKIFKTVKQKKITKPKSFSTKDCFNFYCNNKIKDNSAFFVYKDVLYLNADSQLTNLENELESKRLEYVSLMDEKEEKPYDLYIQRDIDFLKSYIQTLTNRINKLLTNPQEDIYVISYEKFRDIIYLHNKQAQKEIINGRRLLLKHGLGYIEARIVERNFKNKIIDQNATKLRKQELLAQGVKEEDLYHSTKNPTGKIKYNIFFVDDNWCRIAWDKGGGAKFMSVYEFKPTDNRKDLNGFRNNFSKANKENPLLKNKYRRYSYI